MTHDTQLNVQALPIPETSRLRRAQQNVAALDESEYFWRDHALWLETQGYKLRPRYQPGWEPEISLDGSGLLDENLNTLAVCLPPHL